jgi:hypothetical protein
MNEIIKDVLEERAEHARTPHVDAARLIRAGRRRRTVRRGMATASVAAVAALSVAITPTVVDLADGNGTDPASDVSKLPVPYADADTLYLGDVSVPRPKYLHELTYASEAGYLAYTTVGSDNDGTFVLTQDGEVTKVSNATGSIEGDGKGDVAWLERASGGWEVVIYRASGELARVEIGAGSSPWIGAVDDGVVYYSQGDRIWSVTAGGEPEPVYEQSMFMVDRTDGVAAIASTSALGFGEPLPTTVMVRDPEGGPIGRVYDLPPYGRLRVDGESVEFLGEGQNGRPVLVDVRTGDRAQVGEAGSPHPQYAALVGDRIVMTAFDWKRDLAVLLSCSEPTECRVVDEQPTEAARDLPFPEDQYVLPDITRPMD